MNKILERINSRITEGEEQILNLEDRMVEITAEQPRILYPARLSFRIDGEIKSFPDKQKLRDFSTTKPALQQMLKELLRQETRQGKNLPTGNNHRKIKKNINELNAPSTKI